MKSMYRILCAAFVLIGVASAPYPAAAQFYFLENPLIGEKAPDFIVDRIDGAQVDFGKYREGKRTIVFFWATWCPHCRVAISKLNESQGDLAQKNIKVMLVDLGEKANVVQRYAEKRKITMDIFLDKTQEIAEKYEIIGLPTLIFIDEQGIVRAIEHEMPNTNNLDKIFKS